MTVVRGLTSSGRTVQSGGGFSTFEVPCDRLVTCQEDVNIYSPCIGMGFSINCARLGTASAGPAASAEQCVYDRDVQLRGEENHAHLFTLIKWTSSTMRRANRHRQGSTATCRRGCNLMFEKGFEGA